MTLTDITEYDTYYDKYIRDNSDVNLCEQCQVRRIYVCICNPNILTPTYQSFIFLLSNLLASVTHPITIP